MRRGRSSVGFVLAGGVAGAIAWSLVGCGGSASPGGGAVATGGESPPPPSQAGSGGAPGAASGGASSSGGASAIGGAGAGAAGGMGQGQVGGQSGVTGGTAGSFAPAGSGGHAGSSAGSSGGAGGSSPRTGGTSGAGGGVRPGTGGTASAACGTATSTLTRPQLGSSEAAMFTVLRYLAQPDAWNPTAGLGAASALTPRFTVAADGSGTHTSVRAALTAAAAAGTARQYILIKPGTYRETLSVTGPTPITLYGAGADASAVVLVSSQSAATAGGLTQSATLTVTAAGFQALNLTISNDFPPAPGTQQAIALYTTGDKLVLDNVRLHGFQDTVFLDTPSPTTTARVYIKNSFIEGDTDFVFGRATAVIDSSQLNYLSSRKGNGSGYYLAPSTSVGNAFGFLVVGCRLTADATAPPNKISLGRSWDQGGTTPTPNGQAIVRESVLGGHINPVSPWAPAATSARPFSATGNRFGEYCNTGPGAAPSP